jgi:hypothetical protein
MKDTEFAMALFNAPIPPGAPFPCVYPLTIYYTIFKTLVKKGNTGWYGWT